MTEKASSGTETFVQMWLKWRSALPATLVREDPLILIRLSQLCQRGEGVSQSELKRELGINQPRLSKLMKKLEREQWITIRGSEADERLRLMTTTTMARDRMASLEADLRALLSAKSAIQKPQKGKQIQEGQQAFKLEE